jgi:uncharacterized membrane protein
MKQYTEVADMSNTITVTFTDPTYAARALDKLSQLHDSQRIRLRGAIEVVKDSEGKVTIGSVRRFNVERDTTTDEGISGPVASAMVSSHLGASLMSGQAGALAGMSSLRIDADGARAVADHLPPGSSALLFQYGSAETAFLAAIIRDLNGQPYAIDITDETRSDLETALRGAGR